MTESFLKENYALEIHTLRLSASISVARLSKELGVSEQFYTELEFGNDTYSLDTYTYFLQKLKMFLWTHPTEG